MEADTKRRRRRRDNREPDDVPYWNVCDRIKFDGDPPESYWLRFGYYRMANDTLRWASQTTLCDRMEIWEELMVKAAIEKPWFRELLAKVMERVSELGQEQVNTGSNTKQEGS